MNFYYTSISFFIVCLTFFEASFANEVCDKSNCKGPLKYYEDVKCIPIYKSPDDCCPHKYNCDHLKNRSAKKCYTNSHEYNIGEAIDKKITGGRCDYQCLCSENRDGIATVACMVSDFFYPPLPRPDCYYPRNLENCGAVEPVCPEKPEDRVTCEVDGRIYRDGEQFSPASNPSQTCYCSAGYTGENVPPYCTVSVEQCLTELYHNADIYQKCAPVDLYLPLINCTSDFRCQTLEDHIIKHGDGSSDGICEYGNMTLNYGDELNLLSTISSCWKCVCEVGPAVTCKNIPKSECNIEN